jgi:hypothetical protein
MNEAFKYNEQNWPILEVTFPKHQTSAADIQDYLSRLGSFFERKEVLLLIIDISEAGWVSAEHRYEISNWILKNKSWLRGFVAGTAYVVKNPILRMALQTFMSFDSVNKVIGPIKVFNSLDQARKWSSDIISNHR